MRRSLLTTITMLGALICLVGGTGLFAALSDTATTGTNTVTSDDLPTSIDIKLGLATLFFVDGSFECEVMTDDLAGPMFSETDLHPGNNSSANYFCLRNDGGQTASHVTVRSIDLTDTDQACTGDEADSGDTSCGGGGPGELADVLSVGISTVDCSNRNQEIYSAGEIGIQANTTTDLTLPAIPAGATVCLQTFVAYRTPEDPVAAQLAQSDTVTWRFRFTAGL
jgi:hypothetical protein